MHIGNWLLWGFVATLVLTSLMAFSQQYNFTRMNIPFILGTIFTADRDKAKVTGFFVHVVNGWIFSFVHVAIFESLNFKSWYFGAFTGFLHGVIAMTVIVPILPGIHPRMASEFQTPAEICQLEPPGFLGLHYGLRTPLSAILAHVIYGIILGTFYSSNWLAKV
ncbi:MAG TPA: hypothetical protein VHP36_06725 [Chitinispirillaceae bacterium]|nr:hypothetical protein [Chitinispirillaceae bacterium]